MILFLDDGETLLGKGCIITLKNNLVTKCHLRSPFVDHSIKKTVSLLKEYDAKGELFVSYKQTPMFNEVVLNYIDSTSSLEKSYRDNVKVYLNLINVFGFSYSKGDLNHYNLLYRKSDDKPFIIDWDHYIDLEGSEENAYKFYKEELTNRKWRAVYSMSMDQVESIFNEEWNDI